MDFGNIFKKKDIRAHFTKDENMRIKNPHIAWSLLLNGFFITILIIALLSGYKYYKIQKYEIEGSTLESDSVKEAIQVEKLDKILDVFKQKEEKRNQYKNTPPVFVDPSR